MYCNYFGFSTDPFISVAQPGSDYQSPHFKRLLNQVSNDIDCKTGVCLILGQAGTGKTTLARNIAKICAQRKQSVAFREMSSYDHLSLTTPNQTPTIFGNFTSDRTQDSALVGQDKAVILLDNAESVSEEFLDQLITDVAKSITKQTPTLLFLIGLPNLKLRLTSERFEAHKKLLIHTHHLERLAPSEIRDYIQHRLAFADYSGENPFTDSAMQRIAELSEGIPRRINTLCGSSLMLANLDQYRSINKNVIERASKYCFLEKHVPKNTSIKSSMATTQSKPGLSTHPRQHPQQGVQSLAQIVQMLNDSSVVSQQKISTHNTTTINQTLITPPRNQGSRAAHHEKLESRPTLKPIPHFNIRVRNNSKPHKSRINLIPTGIAVSILSIALGYPSFTDQSQSPNQVVQDIAGTNHSSEITNIPADTLKDNRLKTLQSTSYELILHTSETTTARRIEPPTLTHKSSQPIDLRSTEDGAVAVDKKQILTAVKFYDSTVNSIKKAVSEIARSTSKIKPTEPQERNTLHKNVATRKANSFTTRIQTETPLDKYEVATKIRASARFQLAQKGISYNSSSFIASAAKGNNEILKLFLDANMPVDVNDNAIRNTALIQAATFGHLTTVRAILRKNPDVNRPNLYGQTALMNAMANGHHDVSQILINYGAT